MFFFLNLRILYNRVMSDRVGQNIKYTICSLHQLRYRNDTITLHGCKISCVYYLHKLTDQWSALFSFYSPRYSLPPWVTVHSQKTPCACSRTRASLEGGPWRLSQSPAGAQCQLSVIHHCPWRHGPWSEWEWQHRGQGSFGCRGSRRLPAWYCVCMVCMWVYEWKTIMQVYCVCLNWLWANKLVHYRHNPHLILVANWYNLPTAKHHNRK